MAGKVKDPLKGINDVLKNLNSEIEGIEKRTPAGLLAAGLHLLSKSQPLVPVEYEKLKASGYAQYADQKKMTVNIGYSAAYAIYVHENTEEKLRGIKRPSGLGTYWNPGGSKFLEAPLSDPSVQDDMLTLVRQHAEVKKKGSGKSKGTGTK